MSQTILTQKRELNAMQKRGEQSQHNRSYHSHPPFTVTTEPLVPDWLRDRKPFPGTDDTVTSSEWIVQHDFNKGLSRIDGDDKTLLRALLTEISDRDAEAGYLLNKIMGHSSCE